MKIIIGASGGIGNKLFSHYSEKEPVYGTFFNYKTGEENEFMYRVDITKPESIRNFVEDIDLYDGKITLINCAGIVYNAMAHKADEAAWEYVIKVNLIGTYNVIRALLPIMRNVKYGRIINLGSVIAQFGTPGTSAYAASKSGLWGLTKAIAEENKEYNITISTLNLGYINAGLGKEYGKFEKLGSLDNIINAIDFLVNSEFVTGTSIDINGGLI